MRGRGNPARGVLAAVAGADRTEIGDSWVERSRYQGTGLAIILASMLGLGGMLMLLTQITDRFSPWYLLIAAFWALIIFNLDRTLVSSFNYGPLNDANTGEKPTGFWYRTLLSAAARILLAMLIAYSVAEPAMLVLFKPEVGQYITKIQQDDADRQAKTLTTSPGYKQQVADIEQPLKAAKNDENAKLKLYNQRSKALDQEINGTGGSLQAGCETQCNRKKRAADTAYKAWKDAQKATADAQTAHDKAMGKLTTTAGAEIASYGKAAKANKGFLNRARALDEAIAKEPGLAARRWGLTALLFLVDLMPVLLKIFSPTSIHDIRVRKRAVESHVAFNAQLAEGRFEGQEEQAERQYQGDLNRKLRREQAEHEAETTRLRMAARLEADQEYVRLGKERDLERIRLEHVAGLLKLRKEMSPTKTMPDPIDDRLILNGRWLVTRDGPPGAGSAGMGQTLLAYDLRRPGTKVVVKRVRPAGAKPVSKQAHARFEKELKRHRKVTSEFVANVLDHGDDPAFGTFLVLPLYRETLAIRMDGAHPTKQIPVPAFVPTLGWALSIIEQCLMGLVDCLSYGLLHLDIKPGNIALDNDGQVRLIDFGLAKELPGPGENSTTKGAGYTLFYAPPEQMRRSPGWVSSTCDVRALGATLYELVTGLPPMIREAIDRGMYDNDGVFDRLREPDLVDMLETHPVIGPAQLVPGLPPQVADVIMRWLEPDPACRTTDVSEAVNELDNARSVLTPAELALEIGPARTVENGSASRFGAPSQV
jgi:hypothetical protein